MYYISNYIFLMLKLYLFNKYIELLHILYNNDICFLETGKYQGLLHSEYWIIYDNIQD